MSRSDAPDEELVARLIAGDQAALGELYDRYAGTAYRTAYRLLGDPGWAEEVVQETMLVLWDRAELYDAGIASLGAWLATIARNRAIDRLRVNGRRVSAMPLSSVVGRGEADDPEAENRVLESGLLLAASRREPEPAAVGEADWLREALARAVATLPLPERQVISLAYSDDLTQAEIATRLGWPLGTVKTRTRRALAALREALPDVVRADHNPRPIDAAAALGARRASGTNGCPVPCPE